jgi:hypothetical protein
MNKSRLSTEPKPIRNGQIWAAKPLARGVMNVRSEIASRPDVWPGWGQGNRERSICDEATPGRDGMEILPHWKGRFVSKQVQNSPQRHKEHQEEKKNAAGDAQCLSASL